MRQRNLFFITLISLALIFTLAGCGGGGSGSSTSTQLESALRTAFQTNLTFPASPTIPAASLGAKFKPLALYQWTWETATFSNIQYSNVVANVVVTEPTAVATATFTVSGNYVLGGHKAGTASNWTTSGSFVLQGAGEVHFVKVDGVWRVASIPGGISLKSSISDSPSISAPVFTPTLGNTLARLGPLQIDTTISSNSTTYPHVLYIIGTRGFGCGSVTELELETNSTYAYQFTDTIEDIAPIGNNYGSINVWQLVEVVPDTTYQLYFSAYINFVTVGPSAPV